jgi:hypothetical protein
MRLAHPATLTPLNIPKTPTKAIALARTVTKLLGSELWDCCNHESIGTRVREEGCDIDASSERDQSNYLEGSQPA